MILVKKIIKLFKIDIVNNKLNDIYIDRKNNCLASKYLGAKFYGNCIITDLNNFQIGKGSNIKNALIESSGGVYIGNYVHCGDNLTIFSSNHNYKNSTKIPYDELVIKQKVIIEDFVWIGANVSIVPGVTIREGSIIGMGAVITKDVPHYALVGGNPAKVIKYRNIELFNKLKEEKKFQD